MDHKWAPNASERGTKLEVVYKWAVWVGYKICTIGATQTLQRSTENQRWPTSGRFGNTTPTMLGGPQWFKAEEEIGGGQQMGSLAT